MEKFGLDAEQRNQLRASFFLSLTMFELLY
jgi:hypothetical protein